MRNGTCLRAHVATAPPVEIDTVKLEVRVDHKEDAMAEERGFCKGAAEKAHPPPMAACTTSHWDGRGTVFQSIEPRPGSEPDPADLPVSPSLTHASFETQCQTATGWHAKPSLTVGEMGLTLPSPPQAIDWEREAQRLTVSLDPGLLLTAARGVVPGATGELIWARRDSHDQSITRDVLPLLIIHGANEPLPMERVQVVPHLSAGDPLLSHIGLVLKAVSEAEDLAERLYAESLTNALAIHFLRRYATGRPPAAVCTDGLPKSKLRRTTEYIDAHLEHDLTLTEIAAVAQMSLAHFARLFKHATGQTPHRYVIVRRIERAKRLLRETAWPLIEISHRVGFTDQSYFTTAFRRHVGMTPKAYPRPHATVAVSSVYRRPFIGRGRPPVATMASGPLRRRHKATPPSLPRRILLRAADSWSSRVVAEHWRLRAARPLGVLSPRPHDFRRISKFFASNSKTARGHPPYICCLSR
jgi:AraC-like DNA-binding protein